MRLTTMLRVLLAATPLAACTSDSPAEDDPKADVAGGKDDAWDGWGSPERFGVHLERQFDRLATTGRAQITPWTETYWPAMEDSFNARWNGASQLSPLEKYDLAFNGWQPPAGFAALRPLTPASCASRAWDRAYYDALGPAARAWSDSHGVGRARNGVDDDGDGQIDECSDFDGMEGWWGSCHAWVPASLLEREPLEPVTVNGVRFEVSDIKALIILMYEESSQIALGERCSLDDPPRDAHGRIIDNACRNTNAGAFHLLLTNLLGRDGRAFGEDRVADREVWNQPITGYRLPLHREVPLAEALRLLGLTGDAYPFNARARRFVEVSADVDYVVESHASTQPTSPRIDQYVRTDHYRYVLELDDAGLIIGGEWIAGGSATPWASSNDRPDYVWLPLGPGRMVNPAVKVDDIRALMLRSRPETRDAVVRTFRKDDGRQIPDFPWAGLTSTITVPEPLVADAVIVHAEIDHSWAYDVVVKLRRGGEELVLFDRNPVGTSTVIVADWPVPQLAGRDAAGDWTLVVTDRDGRNIGKLTTWSLRLTGRAAAPPVEPPAPPSDRTVRYASTGAALAIPDNDPAGVVSELIVPDALTATAAEVTLAIAHPYRGDLVVELSHGGVTQTLHARTGGAADDLRATLRADVFTGARTDGAWTLRVTDRARVDVGQLEGWSLRLTGR